MSTSRSLRGLAAGALALLIGFVLLLHPDFWWVTYPNGVSGAPYAADFETLARLLMYAGAVLSVASTIIWMTDDKRGKTSPPIS
jgi:hypothetical protein